MPYRSYTRNPLGGILPDTVVTKLVIINVMVFILELFLRGTTFIETFGLSPSIVLERGWVWQIFTYMFLHGGFWHLFLNMFIIWMFGSQLEEIWGGSRFLRYYIVCGLGGAALSFLFARHTTVIGASGAGYGIMLAYAVLFPYAEIYVWGILPVRARTLVIFMTVIEFVSGITGGDGIAHFAHLGGMAAGLLYLRAGYRPARLWRRLRAGIQGQGGRTEGDGARGRHDRATVDAILDKISEKGYESLSDEERRILEEYSRPEDRH